MFLDDVRGVLPRSVDLFEGDVSGMFLEPRHSVCAGMCLCRGMVARNMSFVVDYLLRI